MTLSDESREPLQNKVATDLGVVKGWRVIAADSSGNALIVDSLSWEMRFDYEARTDGQPVYVGFAPPGTATTTETWLIQKFTFTVVGQNSFVSRRQVAENVAWDSRTSSF